MNGGDILEDNFNDGNNSHPRIEVPEEEVRVNDYRGSSGTDKLLRTIIGFFAIIGILTLLTVPLVFFFNPLGFGSMVNLIGYIKQDAFKNPSAHDLVQGAMKGMVGVLDDPYSTYLTPKEHNELKVTINGKFGGIGLEFTSEKDTHQLKVMRVFKNTPAFRAGMQAGDYIIKINGDTTKNMSTDKAASLMRGDPGTQVKVSVFRDSDKQEHEFKMIRSVINVPSVESKMINNDPKIAYIELSKFQETSDKEFVNQLEGLLQQGAQGLILDLRNNPGGSFWAAQEVADTILEKGIIVSVADNKGNKEVYEAVEPGLEMPIVVLVNGGSASASEILAGALKDNKAAVLVGEKTFGKGLVQQIMPLRGGDALKLTIQKYFTPNGTDINKIGIVPDYTVTNPPNSKKDPQLDKALAIVRSEIKPTENP